LSLRIAMRLNSFDFAEKVLDQVSSLVDFLVDGQRLASS
jgi:hypothetical protein